MSNKQQFLAQWEYIPINAFLYFPEGDDVKIGDGQKQWRKIFEGGLQFSQFEEDLLKKLQEKMVEKQTTKLDHFFTKINKLRFLQANKWKKQKTIDSMQQSTEWRSRNCPIVQTPQIMHILNSGAFYFIGRDDQFRPIIMVDIAKFKEEDQPNIALALTILMEFMISNLLIEGQVQNYVLIMDLNEFSFGMRSIVMSIISFTSNSFRGRLFASYLLFMPTLLKWGWEGLVSKFVSENTLRKIKISGENFHKDMWNHISRDIIEKPYGGDLEKLTEFQWPPKKEMLLYENPKANNPLISPYKYQQLYGENKLILRKIKNALLSHKRTQKATKKQQTLKQVHSPVKIQFKESQEGLHSRQHLQTLNVMQEVCHFGNITTIKTFFQSEDFQSICRG